MKIGIMTFWWSEDNYGQILQCYALQKYLCDAGHDAYLIRYDPRNDYVKTPIWKKMFKVFNPVILYRFLEYRKRRCIVLQERKEHPRHFEVFREKHINQSEKIYYSYNELRKDPPKADIYIVGSDQVWNTFGGSLERTKNIVMAYLLDFGTSDVKRIAYAVSFGKETLDISSIDFFTPLLKKFNYISVREKSGLEICKNCGIENVEWVPDPTILINKDVYKSLYKEVEIKYSLKPYCFLYLLGNKFDFPIKKIYEWAKKKDINIIYVTGNLKIDRTEQIYATIPDWLYLISNSKYIITNSYHCSIFSLIFEKQFGIIQLTKGFMGMNSRFLSLFDLFKIKSRFIKTDFSILDMEINWFSIHTILIKLQKNFKLNEQLVED